MKKSLTDHALELCGKLKKKRGPVGVVADVAEAVIHSEQIQYTAPREPNTREWIKQGKQRQAQAATTAEHS